MPHHAMLCHAVYENTESRYMREKHDCEIVLHITPLLLRNSRSSNE